MWILDFSFWRLDYRVAICNTEMEFELNIIIYSFRNMPARVGKPHANEKGVPSKWSLALSLLTAGLPLHTVYMTERWHSRTCWVCSSYLKTTNGISSSDTVLIKRLYLESVDFTGRGILTSRLECLFSLMIILKLTSVLYNHT